MNPPFNTSDAEARSPIALPNKPWNHFAFLSTALTVAYILPLRDLVQYGLSNELYSHCWLMPIVAVYLIWMDRDRIDYQNLHPIRAAALIPFALATISFLVFWTNRGQWTGALLENQLSSITLSYVMALYGAGFLTLGPSVLRSIAFPLFLTLFMVPFPVFVKEAIETFFQHTSANAAFWMIKLVGLNIYREGLVFHLPSIVLEVAPQCSGIRSSLVLLVTSLIASQLFLQTTWKKAALVLFVIPLAIARNGFRITTIAYLCEGIGPDMIHSWVHRSGGPLFFALSLIPFFIVLYLLRRSEPKDTVAKTA